MVILALYKVKLGYSRLALHIHAAVTLFSIDDIQSQQDPRAKTRQTKPKPVLIRWPFRNTMSKHRPLLIYIFPAVPQPSISDSRL